MAFNNTANVTLKETPSFILVGFDTYPSLERQYMGDFYALDNPSDQVTLRCKIMYNIHENIRNIILNNTEQ